MSVQAFVYARLAAHAGTAALVGTRIYPLHLPPSPTYPAITYEVLDGERYSSMSADGDINDCEVQVFCWAASEKGATDLAEQVRLALQRFSGAAGGVTVDDIFITPGGSTSFEMSDATDSRNKVIYTAERSFRVIARE